MSGSRSTRSAALGLAAVATSVSVLLGGGCAKGSGSKKAFCRELRSVPRAEVFFRGFNPAGADAVQATDRQTAQELLKLERAAPRQIKPDVSAVADLEADIADVVKQYGSDRATLQTKLVELGQQRVGAATSAIKVSDYARHECSISVTARRSATPPLTGATNSDTTTSPSTDTSS